MNLKKNEIDILRSIKIEKDELENLKLEAEFYKVLNRGMKLIMEAKKLEKKISDYEKNG